MTNEISPFTVKNRFEKGRINKSEYVDLLIYILEENEDLNLRLKSLELLGNFRSKSRKIFSTLERCLITDEEEKIRSLSLLFILKNYRKEGEYTIKWVIKHEKSTKILKALKNTLYSSEQRYKGLKEMFEKRMEEISNFYGTTGPETEFIIDLEVELKPNYLYQINNTSKMILSKYYLFLIKDNRITSLSLSLRESLPESIGFLTNLKHLDLSHNYFSILPEEFKHLDSLKTIDLSWNDFHEFPFTLSKIEFKYDVQLKLSHNSIECFPLELKGLKKTKFLDLSFNHIDSIPMGIDSLESLEVLNLENNKIHEISEEISLLYSLKYLNLSNNKLDQLPESMRNMCSLEALDLRGNKLSDAPEFILRLPQLKEIYI
ncbi:MAG: hypothetical protein GF353_21195 [Candidatus Lokiarchaeota archaeon]|nr:hypothetical protein [Candidatus Lokiarchaeota archaeon]